MRSFSNCEKRYNKQFAVAYIIYMIGGSYFYKCDYPKQCKRLYLHYAEMPRQKQYEYEEKVIKTLERMDKEFLENLKQLKCEVLFHNEAEKYKVEFRTYGFESLKCIVHRDGRFQILAEKI